MPNADGSFTHHTIEKIEPVEEKEHITNCKNCGAILKGCVCEYCGTRY